MTEEQKIKMDVVFNEHLSYGSKPVPEDLFLPQSRRCGDHASHQPGFCIKYKQTELALNEKIIKNIFV